LSQLILFGERALQRAVTEFVEHFHAERNHQGKDNQLLFRRSPLSQAFGQETVRCDERLGGLLKYYRREASRIGTRPIHRGADGRKAGDPMVLYLSLICEESELSEVTPP
jgi:hypothetical protein